MQKCIMDILQRYQHEPVMETSNAWADSNIALCKYWGKRDEVLNLPVTDSLSVSLPGLGTEACIKLCRRQHRIQINQQSITTEHAAYAGLIKVLNAFHSVTTHYYALSLTFNIPMAAGLASSASCHASIVSAMHQLYNWPLTDKERSILARCGSGSAARSLGPGFYHWHRGERSDGMDSYASHIPIHWSKLRLGIVMLDPHIKKISSRIAMRQTMQTAALYQSWPEQVERDLPAIKSAINKRCIDTLGKHAEHNAMTMHACMHAAWPSIVYDTIESHAVKQAVRDCRAAGIKVYFTQDAGPNIKLLFEQQDRANIQDTFSNLRIIAPFGETDHE